MGWDVGTISMGWTGVLILASANGNLARPAVRGVCGRRRLSLSPLPRRPAPVSALLCLRIGVPNSSRHPEPMVVGGGSPRRRHG